MAQPGKRKSAQDRQTPPGIIRWIEEQLGPIRLDAAATSENAVVPTYIGKDKNGLVAEWTSGTFCNPPYADILPWIEKGIREHLQGNSSVFLLPVSIETRWFRLAARYGKIFFLYPRFHMKTPQYPDEKPAPNAPSCLVWFNGLSIPAAAAIDEWKYSPSHIDISEWLEDNNAEADATGVP